MTNTLYYGDNLDILRRYIKDETVDLIYLDPPFNSNANYNVLFAEQDGKRAAAQIRAFEDTWTWDQEDVAVYEQLVERGGKVSEALQAFRMLLGSSNMMSYLVMMSVRLIELHRVLKPTGSLYLHCDPTASHYLKILLDAIFGPVNFSNEIIWERSSTRSSISKSYRRAHDVLLFYTKSDRYIFNMQFKGLSEASMKLYENVDEHGKYQLVPLLVSGIRNGSTGKPWKGVNPGSRGKAGMHWVTTPDKLDAYDAQGRVVWPNKENGTPRLKYYLSQSPGVPLNDIWYDIGLIPSSSKEALGYPTQKPEALLDRIIHASSKPGDLVMDPFCGCGTAVISAEKQGRQWIGIDVTYLAINAIRRRFKDSFGEDVPFKIIGEPTTLPDAIELAHKDPYQFQWWALGLVGARPAEGKKGADSGIDGKIFFHDELGGATKQVIISVKGGGTNVAHIRDLCHVVDREKAQLGVLICLHEASKPMYNEAVNAGFYKSPWGTTHPKIQILTVEELLDGREVSMPASTQQSITYKRAPKHKPTTRQLSLDES